MRLPLDFTEKCTSNQLKIVHNIHSFLSTFDNISMKIRYHIPFYFIKSWVCYLNPIKHDGVEMAFTRANELPDDIRSSLDFKDRKQIGGVLIEDADEIPWEKIETILEAAIELDAHIPYASKRR